MKNPEQFRVARPRFIAEQDGPPERELKNHLVELFDREQGISRAYLARVAYEGSMGNAVALCLRTASDDRSVVEQIGKVFASIFAGREHLDIIFVTEAQEAELAGCCRPFFKAIS